MPTVSERTEEEKLFGWRVEIYERLGYSSSDATDMAMANIDWRLVDSLIARGCSLELARRIAE